MRLFDLMFSDAEEDEKPRDFEQFQRLRQSGLLGGDRLESQAAAYAEFRTICTVARRVIEEQSPVREEPDEVVGAAPGRKRVLMCDTASSADMEIRTGEFDKVGGFALVREEPGSEVQTVRTQGADVDVLKLYIFWDRAFKNGALPKDLLPTLVHDVGGYLFANFEYFVNSDSGRRVSKASREEVDAASRNLMDSIGQAIEAKEASGLVAKNQKVFADWIRRN